MRFCASGPLPSRRHKYTVEVRQYQAGTVEKRDFSPDIGFLYKKNVFPAMNEVDYFHLFAII